MYFMSFNRQIPFLNWRGDFIIILPWPVILFMPFHTNITAIKATQNPMIMTIKVPLNHPNNRCSDWGNKKHYINSSCQKKRPLKQNLKEVKNLTIINLIVRNKKTVHLEKLLLLFFIYLWSIYREVES